MHKYSYTRLACRCSKKARGYYKYFSIGFYGECWAGNNMQLFDSVVDSVEQRTTKCVTGSSLSPCNDADDKGCAGVAFTEYLYLLTGGEQYDFVRFQTQA